MKVEVTKQVIVKMTFDHALSINEAKTMFGWHIEQDGYKPLIEAYTKDYMLGGKPSAKRLD